MSELQAKVVEELSRNYGIAPAQLEGSAPPDRCFVDQLLQALSEQPALLRADAANLVRILVGGVEHAGGWSIDRFKPAFQKLVNTVQEERKKQRDPDSDECKAAVEMLCAFLAETGAAADRRPELFLDPHKRLVKAMLRALKADIGENGKDQEEKDRILESACAYPIALMLAAYYSLIRDDHLRMRLIRLLRTLIRVNPNHYADPFIEDLVIIYDRMHLSRLQ
jgi:hypothetical protein